MKKKYIIIPLLVLLIAAGAAFGFAKSKSVTFETARVIKANNGAYLYVSDDGPVRMTDITRSQKLFENLQTGDKVLVAHSGVEESYPGITAAYACIKLKSGSESDVPADVMHELEKLGWTGKGVESSEEKTQAVEMHDDLTSMSFDLPDDWDVKKTFNNASTLYTVTVTPKGSKASATVTCYVNGDYGVCGTGLFTEVILDGDGSVGYYDNDPLWSFIVINKGETKFVAENYGLSAENAEILRAALENGCYEGKTDGKSTEFDVDKLNVKYTRVHWHDDAEEAFNAFAMKSDDLGISSKLPYRTVVLKSKDELDGFINDTGNLFGFSKKMPYEAYKNSFMYIADSCDESFFESKVLLVTYIAEGSGSVTHSVESVTKLDDTLYININRNVPEVGTCDMASWFISMELDKTAADGLRAINANG